MAKLEIEIGAVTTGLAESLRDAESKLESFGKQATQIGKTLSLAVTAPLTGFAALTLNTFGNFEASLNKASAITGATGEDFEKLKNKARDLGATTQFSASQAADAITFLGQAGFSTNKILDSLDDTLKLAAASGLDLGRSADIVSNVLTGFRLETSELGKTVDILSKAFTTSNQDLDQLSEALKFVGPVAASFGTSIEESVAAIGALSDAGLQGSVAGTGLRRVLSTLGSEAGKLGIVTTDSAGKLRPLADIIEDIEKKGLTASQALEIFGDRGGPAISVLLARGSASLREYTKELENSGGTADRLANVQTQGLNGALKTLRSAFEELQLRIGESGLAGAAQKLVEGLTGLLRKLSELDSTTISVITAVAALVAGIGPALLAFGSLVKLIPIATAGLTAFRTALIAATGPFGLIATAIAVALPLLFELNKELKRTAQIAGEVREKQLAENLQQTRKEVEALAEKYRQINPQLSEQEAKQRALNSVLESYKNVLKNVQETDPGNLNRIVQIKEEIKAIEGLIDEFKEVDNSLNEIKQTSKLTFEEFSKLADIANEKVFSQFAEDARLFNEELKETISLQNRIANLGSKIVDSFQIADIKIDLPEFPPVIEFPEIDDSSITKFVLRLREFEQQIGEILSTGISNTIGDFAFSIGEAFASGQNVLKSAGAALLGGIAGILNQLGQLAIGTGIAISGIKKSLQTLNPIAAIAGGAALVALAGVISATSKRLAGNFGGGSAGVAGGSAGVGSGIGSTFGGGATGFSPFAGDREIRLVAETDGAKLRYVIDQSNAYQN